MVSTHINLFDAAVIGILILSCLFAFYRGFVREILSLGAWIGAGIVTIYYFPVMAEKLQPHFKSAVIAAGFGTVGIYIVALICFSIVNMFILKFVKSGSDVGMLDNILGLIFGAFRGALIVSLGFFLLSLAMPEKEYPDWLKQARTRPYAEKGAVMLVKIAPEYLREISSLEKKAAQMGAQAKAADDDKTDSHPLDRLTDSAKQ
jgi:membrane protein required for colicin V production